MGIKVKLSELIETLDLQSQESTSYLNKETGEFITISMEEFQAAEDGDSLQDYPDWQHDNIKTARIIINSENDSLLELPTKFDIDEYSIMDKFSMRIDDKDMYEQLYCAIRGKGAFRRFKDCVHEFGIAEKWYKYRNNAYKEIAIEWCSENQIEYIDDSKE